MNIPTAISTLLIGILLTLVSLWVGQHNGLLPIAASAEAPQIDQLFNAMVAISTGLFVLVQGALVYSLFAFRRRRGDHTDASPVHGNVPLEIVWTAIPSMIVLWLAIYSFDVYQAVNSADGGQGFMAHHATSPQVVEVAEASPSQEHHAPQLVSKTDAGSPEPLAVKVTGLQYAWLFYYEGSAIPSPTLHLPVDRPVDLTITANDVIHAFWVPEFRLKQDAIPGQETQLRFTPNKLGTYTVICAELCGSYHGGMKAQVMVESAADYQAWQEERMVAAKESGAAIATHPTPTESPLALLDEQVHAHHLTPNPGEIADLATHDPAADLATVTQPDHPAA